MFRRTLLGFMPRTALALLLLMVSGCAVKLTRKNSVFSAVRSARAGDAFSAQPGPAQMLAHEEIAKQQAESPLLTLRAGQRVRAR